MIRSLLRSIRSSFNATHSLDQAMRPVIENLETRAMLSVDVTGNNVTVKGDDGGVIRDDAIVLRRSGSNPANLEVLVNGQIQLTRAISQINTLGVFGGKGNDTLTIDNAKGAIALPSATPMTFDGGAGTNSVVVMNGFASSAGFFQLGNAAANAGDVSKTIDGQFQRLTFSNTQLVRELSGASRFLFVGATGALENITLDNGSSDSDGILRITHTMTGRTFADLEFAKKEELILDADQGSSSVFSPGPVLTASSGSNDSVFLRNSESAGLKKVSVKLHQGNDSAIVEGQSAPLAIDTGDGNNGVRLGKSLLPPPPPGNFTPEGDAPPPRTLDALKFNIDVTQTPDGLLNSSGSTTLILDDTGDTINNTGTITASSVTGFGLGGTVSYSNMVGFRLILGSGNDTVNVRSTMATNTFLSYGIQTGAGDDLVRLGSLGNGTERGNGTVNSLLGSMSVQGQDGFDTLVVDDSGETVNSTATFSTVSPFVKLAGLGMGDLLIQQFEVVHVMFGSGNDTFVDQMTDDDLPQIIIDLGTGG